MAKSKSVKSILYVTILFLVMLAVKVDSSVETSAPESNSFSDTGRGSTPGYTGDISIDVPLLTIPGRTGLGFPLTLSYSPGIRVEQEASWVGLGWDISTGVITRNAVNFPDDYKRDGGSDPQNGWIYGGDTSGDCYNEGDPNNPDDDTNTDCEDQDNYAISIPGVINGKFFATLQGVSINWYMRSYVGAVKIEPIFTNNRITKWNITNIDGTQYIFSEMVSMSIPNIETKTFSWNTQDRPNINYNIRSRTETDQSNQFGYAWYLTEIRSPDYVDYNGNSIADDIDRGNWIKISYTKQMNGAQTLFEYRVPNYNNDPLHLKLPAPFNQPNCGIDPGLEQFRDDVCGYQFQGWKINDLNAMSVTFSKRTTRMERTFPTRIETPTNLADFEKSQVTVQGYSRADLTDYQNLNAPPVLQKITLKSKISSEKISEVRFTYSSPSQELAKGSEGNIGRGKLTLFNVTTHGCILDNCDNYKLPPTSFIYSDTQPGNDNPNYHALANDYWGYFNGKTANDMYDFYELNGLDVFNHQTCSSVADGYFLTFDFLWKWWQMDDNHSTGFPFETAAWSIRKVIYPTGGSIEYEYENDQYSYDQARTLKSDLNRPRCDPPNNDKQYLWGGVGGGLRLKSKTISDGLNNSPPNTITINYEYVTGVATDKLGFVSSQVVDWNRLGAHNNLYVGYELIREITPGYGKTETTYTSARTYPSRETARAHQANGEDFLPDFLWAWRLSYQDDLEFKRGLIKNIRTYKEGVANPFSIVNHYYTVDSQIDPNNPDNPLPSDGLPTIQSLYDKDNTMMLVTGQARDDLNHGYKIFSGWSRLQRTEKNIDGVTSTTLYSNYDVSNEQPKRVEEINTEADGTPMRRISTISFAHEYPSSYQWAIDKNIFSLPKFSNIYKNSEATESNRLSWQENEYSNFRPLGQPQQYYLIWQSAWLDTNNDNIFENSEKITTSRINTYDYYGQPLETLDANSKITKFYFGGPSGQECTNTPSDNRYKNAFLTCLQKGSSANHQIKTHYNNDGTISEIIDENNQVTKFQYDEFNRLIESTLPAESNPTVKYDYQYALGLAALSPAQRTTLGAQECANGISEKCTNRVKTTTILNYRGTTPESEFKVAKYWDGLGRVHMNDIMMVPGEKHIRTINEYNEIGQIYSTSDVYIEDRTDWIRKSPQMNFIDSILTYLGLKKAEITKPIKVSHLDDENFEGFSLPTFNSNINPITGQLIKETEIIDPDGGGGGGYVPHPDKSYITYEKSPLVRPDTAYALDGDYANGPDPNDPQVKTEFNSEAQQSDNQCRLEVDFCQSSMTVDQFLGQGPNPITEGDCRVMGIEYCSGCPTGEVWCTGIPDPLCSYDCDGSSNAACNGGNHVQGNNIQCDRLLNSQVIVIGNQYQCWARCASEPISYKKEVLFTTLNTYTKVTDEEQKTVKTYSDKFGNNLRTIAAQDTPKESITDYTYDILGRVIGVVNPEGQATINEYDTLGRSIKTTSPDFGTIKTTYFNNGNIQTRDHNGIITTYLYDDLNRVTRIDYSYNNADPNFPVNLDPVVPGPIIYYYDTYDQGTPNLRDSTRCGLVTGYPSLGFPNGRLVAVEKYTTGLTQLSSLRCLIYNEKGQITEQIDRISPSTSLYKTKYEYNLAGSLIRSINPAPANIGTTYDYNNLNQIVQMNINNYFLNPSFEINNNNDNLPDNWEIDGDAINDFFVLGYDNTLSYLPPQGSYAYRIKVKPNMINKGISQNVKVINAQEYTLSFKFNLRWANPPNTANGFKVIIKKDDDTIISTTSFVANTYSSNTWHTGTVTFTASCNQGISCVNKIKFLNYDGAIINEWHLDSIKLEPGDSATDFSFANYQYNYDQTVRNLLFGNGVQTNFFYTPRKWMTVIDTKGPAPNYNQLFARTYSYTSSGDVSGIYDNYDLVHPGDTSTLNDLEWFGYDDLHRLTSDTIDGDLGLGANAVLSYNYDKAGNRLLESLTNSPGNNFQSNYQYTSPISKNRLNSVTRTGINPSTTLFTYDTRGNTITQSNPLAFYYYNADNMLSKVCFNLACNNYESYSYNSDGLRILKYTNPSPGTFTRTYYIYDISGNLIFEDYEYNV